MRRVVLASLYFVACGGTSSPAGSLEQLETPADVRAFCNAGRPLPTAPLAWPALPIRVAPGEDAPPAIVPTGPGWTWVNLWASWCPPCVDELPILARWQAELGGPDAFRLVLISLEEEPDALPAWLAAGKAPGVAATYHLPEGDGRTHLLAALGVPKTATLPIQIALDPEGRVRCVRVESVEAAQFETVRRVIGRE